MVALALLFGGMTIIEFTGLNTFAPRALEMALGLLGFALTVIGFSFVFSWAAVLLGTFAMVFALKWGRAGWGTAVLFGLVMGLLIGLYLSEGDAKGTNELWVFAAISVTGGFLGLVYWVTCYRLAPRAFRAPPPK